MARATQSPKAPAGRRPRLTQSTHCCAPRGASRVTPAKALRWARLFRALGDETRIEILGVLAAARAPICVCEIEENFRLHQPTISHHLRILRECGLVSAERRGLWVYYGIEGEALDLLEEVAGALH